MKRGGTKRKIPIAKRETIEQRSVTCNKRRKTIFSKSADLCRLSGANIAVFVTSPSETSDVVYSFSGYSPAYEIADCYFNGKPPPKKINPQAKLGFLWEDPNLYRNCGDLSELNIIEDRLVRLKKDIMECLEKKEKSQLGSDFDQNATTCSLDDITCGSDQNPNLFNDPIYGKPSSSQVNQNPSSFVGSSSSDQSCSFENGTGFGFEDGLWETKEQNNSIMSLTQETQTEPNATTCSLDDITCGSDQNPNFFNDQIYGKPSSSQANQNPSSFVGSSSSDQSYGFENGTGFGFGSEDGLWETKEENNSIMSLIQETQTEPKVNVDDESFWNDIFNNHVWGLNSDFHLDDDNNPQDMFEFDIRELLNEEEIENSSAFVTSQLESSFNVVD